MRFSRDDIATALAAAAISLLFNCIVYYFIKWLRMIDRQERIRRESELQRRVDP